MAKQMHLISFLIHSPMNHTILSWADQKDERLANLGSIKAWQDLGRTLEKGRFDAIFFADTPGVFDRYKERADEAVRYGVCWPAHDPTVLLPAMGAATECLGLAVTLSISVIPPYNAVRTLSTIDYLTGGRAGWNVVTGHLRGEHRALGIESMDHDERYDRADEHLEVCHKLWNGIHPGAVIADRASGEFADPRKVDRIRHSGKYFKYDGVAPVLPSPQGHPVIFQAGSSGRGQEFAVKHAEVMFSIQPHVEGMQRYMGQIRDAGAKHGRKDPIRVLFGVQPIIGGTEAEAQKHYDDLLARVPVEAALARLSGSLGVDFSTFELDKPLEEQPTNASQGMMKAMTAMVGGKRMTLREIAQYWGMGVGMMPIIGTPDQVADRMETIWRETGCCGFNLTPTINDGSIRDFVDEIVPRLQKKGVYRTDYAHSTLRGNLSDD